MTTNYQGYVVCSTAGEALSAIAADLMLKFTSAYSSPLPAFALVLGTYAGFRAAKLTEDVGSGPFDRLKTVVVGQGEDELISPREIVMQPGFSTRSGTWVFHLPMPSPGQNTFDLDSAEASWKDVIVSGAEAMVNEWTSGTADDPVYATVDNDPGTVRSTTGMVMVSGLGQAWPTVHTLRLTQQDDTLVAPPDVLAPELAHEQSTVMCIALGKLVNAIDAITNQDIEISMNQGAFVYSVKAKVAVTAPGP